MKGRKLTKIGECRICGGKIYRGDYWVRRRGAKAMYCTIAEARRDGLRKADLEGPGTIHAEKPWVYKLSHSVCPRCGSRSFEAVDSYGPTRIQYLCHDCGLDFITKRRRK